MPSTKNLALMFRKIPEGYPKPGQDVTVEDLGGYDPSASAPDGGVVLEMLYASFDPYLRGLLRPAEKKSYFPALPVGKPIRNNSISKVLKSSNPDFKEGDLVQGHMSIQQFTTLSTADEVKSSQIRNLDTTNGSSDIRDYLGALGMPGLTAYSSLLEIGKPQKGETIFVSSAAGAVGQLVGQLAKHLGLRVVGSVGSDEKLSYLTDELGFDGGFNYKTEKPSDALARLCPDGIDIYYENVGGEQLSAALDHMNNHGRIVACGMISQYNLPESEQYGVKNIFLFVSKRLTMRGFLVGDAEMGPKWSKEHQENIRKWLKDGSFKAKVHEFQMDKADEGLVGMFKGENFGKAVLKVKQDL